ncbi:MAG: hypothetical protein ACOC8F_07960, partial [Planctomycetota bacterium]
PPQARTAAISRAVADVVASRPGAWQVAALLSADVPRRRAGLACSPRPAEAVRPGGGRRRVDGLLLAPLAPEHPDAWRFYNVAALRCAAERVHPGAPVLLRTQVSSDRLAAVARTFLEAIGSGRILAVKAGRGYDVLLGGPESALAGSPAVVWTGLEAFCASHPGVPVRLDEPASWSMRR